MAMMIDHYSGDKKLVKLLWPLMQNPFILKVTLGPSRHGKHKHHRDGTYTFRRNTPNGCCLRLYNNRGIMDVFVTTTNVAEMLSNLKDNGVLDG